MTPEQMRSVQATCVEVSLFAVMAGKCVRREHDAVDSARLRILKQGQRAKSASMQPRHGGMSMARADRPLS